MNIKHIISVLLIAIILTSCGSKKRVVTTRKKNDRKERPISKRDDNAVSTSSIEKEDEKVTVVTPTVFKDQVEAYVFKFKDAAMKEMGIYKIPASITLAQGILESGSGKGRLAVEANNHFGIKCHKGWTGGRIYHDDDEDQECFRTYKDAIYSYRDHSLFLIDRKRYATLFNLPIDDYKSWAHGLRKAGYATDRKYPKKLISLIERYELYNYDAIVLGKKPEDATRIVDKSDTHTVTKGDTLYRIARKYNITVEQLKEYNGLSNDEISIGQVLYTQPLPKDF